MDDNTILSAPVNIDKAVFVTVVSSGLKTLPVKPCTNIQKNMVQQQMR